MNRICRARRIAPGRLALLLMLFMGSAFALTPDEASTLLKTADGVKSSDYAAFASAVRQLDEHSSELAPAQLQYLHYLQGWKSAYDGDYKAAIPILESVVAQSSNVTLRFRAGVTAANVSILAAQYETAFSQLGQLLALLPELSDREAREQGLAVAADLYNQVGEYDLALSYAQRLLKEKLTSRGACVGGQSRLEALYKSGRLRSAGAQFDAAIAACISIGEVLTANAIRTYMARLHIDLRQYDEAIDLLTRYYDELRATRYPRLIAEYDSLLARAYHQKGDETMTRQFALRAIEDGVKNQFTEPVVIANRLLYEMAKQHGDIKAALTYHEQYAAADKGYLDDVSARQMAYERVNHKALASQLQISALNRQNEVLRLQRALDRKAAEASRLYIVVLLMAFAFIAFWAYRTKRSQLHFMRLSRLDGLTGIANRPHFIEQAERALENNRKSQQETCIVLCDLDHFKSINDKYGHAAGDFVLQQTVATCSTHLQPGDLFGRFGGEEFGILLPACSLTEAQRCAERLRRAILGIAVHRDGDAATVSASFGIATSRSSGYELRQLLAHADTALYEAKHAGRNRVVCYDAMDVAPAQTRSDEFVRGVGS